MPSEDSSIHKIKEKQGKTVTERLAHLQDKLNQTLISNSLILSKEILEEIESAITMYIDPNEQSKLDNMKKEIECLLKFADKGNDENSVFYYNENIFMKLKKKIRDYDRELKLIQYKNEIYI